MKRNTLITTLGIAAMMATTALVPTMASASVQNNKNNARNLAIAGAAVAGLGLLTHNTGATIFGAGAALIGESQAQHDQNIENSWHDRWGYNNYDRDYHRNYDQDRGCR